MPKVYIRTIMFNTYEGTNYMDKAKSMPKQKLVKNSVKYGTTVTFDSTPLQD